MLNIYLGDMKEAVYHPPTYFDNMYEDEWITNSLSVEMILDVDKSAVVGPHLIEITKGIVGRSKNSNTHGFGRE